jgi:predicted MFS family arabinose efflux permease
MMIAGAGILAACQVGKVPVAAHMLQHDMGLTMQMVSWLVSAFAVVGALGGIVTGFVADRIGYRRTAAAGLWVLAAGSLAGAFAQGAAGLIASRILEGLGFLGVVVAAPTLIGRTIPAHIQDRAMAVWSTFMPVGLTIVMLAAPLLALLGWRGFWVLQAVLLAGYAVWLHKSIEEPTQHTSRRPVLRDIRDTLAAPGPWLLGGLFATFSATFFALFGLLPTYLTDHLRMSAQTASILSAIAVAVSALGNIAGGQLRNWGLRPGVLLMLGFVTMALSAAGIFQVANSAAAVLVLCVLFSFASGLVPVVILASAAHHAPRPALLGATMGLIMQGNNIGLLIGPGAAGVAVAAFDWPAVSILIGAFALVALCLIIVFGRLSSAGHQNLREVNLR